MRPKENLVKLCVSMFFLGNIDKMLPKSRFSKAIFGHSAGRLTRTGPIANSSDLNSLKKDPVKQGQNGHFQGFSDFKVILTFQHANLKTSKSFGHDFARLTRAPGFGAGLSPSAFWP